MVSLIQHSVESQPQNPEFRNNPENFTHACPDSPLSCWIFYVLHSFPILILLTCNIPVVSMFQSDWKTVWILIRWLCPKPADLDLHRFQKNLINPRSARQGWINILSVKLCIFSYPSILTCVLGAQKNCLSEMVLLSTHNKCFGWEIRKLFFEYALLSRGLPLYSNGYSDLVWYNK